MASLHESTDFVGNSELPRRWEDDVFRFCTFAKLDLEGKAFEGILSHCTLRDSSWYWGLFNTTQFVEVEFHDCAFHASAFVGCLFAKCRFVNCKFAKDNLDASCSFDKCSWYECEQAGCEGLPDQFAGQQGKRRNPS